MKENFFEKRQLYYRKNEHVLDRPTLVFVHGVSGSSSAWVPYEEKFKNEYNILSFDLRGHGKSEKPTEYDSYKIELFADDIYELLQHLNIQKCILISHSFGSVIALSFLGDHQDLVSGAILISPQSSVGDMLSAKIIKPILYGIIKFLPKIKLKKVGEHVDYQKYKNSGDWNVARTFADVRNTGLRVYLYCVKQTYLFDGQHILDMIKIPTLIIHGKNDTIFPLKYAKEVNQSIKDSEIVVIENSDHILVLNNFDEVSKLINKFVSNLTTGK